jgi:homoserine kinase
MTKACPANYYRRATIRRLQSSQLGEPMQQVTIRVPASTSNLGPGFDCLGVALRIYNDITVTRGGKWPPPLVARQTAALFFKRAGQPFSFSCSITGRILRARGLGSSATIRLGLLHALNELSGRRLDRLSMFKLCAELEGHPDNAAPASFGGFTVARGGHVQRFAVSQRLFFVLLIPDFEIKTAAARRVLPARITRMAAVQNCSSACAITAAFASRRYENLRGNFVDQLHQPFREKLIPFLPDVIVAAEKAGALGAFLSGSGPSICAITLQGQHKVAAAMLRAVSPAPKAFGTRTRPLARSTSARTLITTADNRGVCFHRSSATFC